MDSISPLDQEHAERVLAEAAIDGLQDALSGRVVCEVELEHLLAGKDLDGLSVGLSLAATNAPAAGPSSSTDTARP